MPKREDLYGADEYAEPEKQLHRHALYHTQPGGRRNAGQRDHVVKFGDEALQPQPMDFVAGLRVDA